MGILFAIAFAGVFSVTTLYVHQENKEYTAVVNGYQTDINQNSKDLRAFKSLALSNKAPSDNERSDLLSIYDNIERVEGDIQDGNYPELERSDLSQENTEQKAFIENLLER